MGIPVFGIIFGTLMTVGIVVVIGIVLVRWGQMHYEARMKMIESSDPETVSKLISRRNRHSALQWGIGLVCLGLALLVSLFILDDPESCWATVPLFVGVGLLIFHFVFVRQSADPTE